MKNLREIMNAKIAKELTFGEATVGSCIASVAIATAMALPVAGFFGACWAIDKVEDFKKKKTEDNKEETTKEN